jgi:hypothetical protein
MASWTDRTPPQFNPYVQQLPVEAMVAVGMEKQKRYDEGVQKIQTNIDNIAGLDVANDADKTYLQSKLNQLGNDLRTVAAGDFSNFQLVNSVSGMTKQIVKDPIIQTAVNSAAKRRKEIEYMEEARKKGTLTPQNQAFFAIRDNEWANATEAGQAYGAKYVDYFDYFKHTKETIDALKIDSLTYPQIFELDANGNPVIDKSTGQPVYSQYMTTLIEEGYKPEKLQAAISQIFSDPRVVQQLSIDGEYNYKGLSEANMTELATSEANRTKNLLEDELDDLYIKLQTKPNDVEIKEAIQKREQVIASLPEVLKTQAQTIYDNPNSARALLFTQKTKQDYMNMFNFTKTSKKYERNPAFDVNFELQKEANRRSEFYQDLNFRKEKAAAEFSQKQAELDLKAREISGAAAQGSATDFTPDVEMPVHSYLGEVNDLQEAASTFENNNLELVFATVFPLDQVVPGKFKTVDGKSVPITNKDVYNTALTANKGDRNKAIKSILNKKARTKGITYNDYLATLTTRVQDQFGTKEARKNLMVNNPNLYTTLDNFEKSQVAFKNQEADFNDRSKRTMSEFYASMEKIPFTEKILKIGGETFTLTKQDAIHLALIAKFEDKSFISGIPETDEYVAYQQAAEGARSALKKAGKEKMLNSFLEQLLPDKLNRAKNDRDPFGGKPLEPDLFRVSETYNYAKYGRKIYKGVYNIFDNINDKTFKESLKKRSEDYIATKYKNPNITSPIMMYTIDKQGNKIVDGKAQTTTLAYLQDIATIYNTNQLGEGVNHKDFLSNALKAEAEDMGKYKKGVMLTSTGYRAYLQDHEGNKLFITDTEAAQKFKFTSTSAYESPAVISAREAMASPNNNYTTSSLDISKTSTYAYPAQMNTWDFPQIPDNGKYEVRAHFAQNLTDKTYFPYLYVSDGVRKKVIPLPLSESSLPKLMQESLPAFVTQDRIEAILNR